MLKGGYPDLNRELTVPHTVVLPFELYPPVYAIKNNTTILKQKIIFSYPGMIRTFNTKYQKFMTYLLVYGIYVYSSKELQLI